MSRTRLLIVSAAIVSAAVFSIFHFRSHDDIKTIQSHGDTKTIWGETINLDDKLRIVADSDIMQRLKGIDQSGPPRYFGPKLPAFSRYDHSIGVLVLLQRAKAPFEELVAGILHDSSYTAFSHVCDFLFAGGSIMKYTEVGYQDFSHVKFLEKHAKTLARSVGLSVSDLSTDNKPRLEQKLPDMCADRIQYNIHTGVILGRISQNEAAAIVQNLGYRDGKWFFTDPVLAKKFAKLSLHFTRHFWGAPWNVSMNVHLGKALKRAMHLGVITMDDLFSTDDAVLKKIRNCSDVQFKLCMQQCDQQLLEIEGQTYHNERFYSKFRGIDPLVKNENDVLVRLTTIDPEFKAEYEEVKEWCSKGFDLRILDVE
jgi:HD superfamily phosphohydrolase